MCHEFSLFLQISKAAITAAAATISIIQIIRLWLSPVGPSPPLLSVPGEADGETFGEVVGAGVTDGDPPEVGFGAGVNVGVGVAASFIVKGTDIEPSEKRISSVCSPALIKDR